MLSSTKKIVIFVGVVVAAGAIVGLGFLIDYLVSNKNSSNSNANGKNKKK